MFTKITRNKKYELIKTSSDKFYRIRALKSFSNVEKGDLGGFVSGWHNLSEHGNSWIYDTSRVTGNAMIIGDATVCENSIIGGSAMVGGFAKIKNSSVLHDAYVLNEAKIDNSTITDKAHIIDKSYILNSTIGGSTEVSRDARIMNSSILFGRFSLKCDINGSNYLIVGPIGSRNDYTTFYRTWDKEKVWASTGCFVGSLSEFKNAVAKTHANNERYLVEYNEAIKLAEAVLLKKIN